MRTGMLMIGWLLTSFALAAPGSGSQGENPKARLEFRVETTEFGDLRGLLVRFAETEGFSVDDYGAQMPPKDGRRLFWLRLVRDDLIEVEITNIRKENQMFVWLYESKPNSGFEALSSKLEQVLHARWPDIAPYKGL